MINGQGQFHSSDQVGNFKVAYTASGGHYLVEDRSADGTSLLGNFGYQSRDGEQVGVAYGSDGAGFVIKGPGASSSYGGGGSSGSRSTAYQQSYTSGGQSGGGGGGSRGISYNAVYDQDPFQRYQQVNYQSSNPALSSSVSSYSSLPASDFSSLFSTQTTSSSSYPQQSEVSTQTYTQPLSYYNPAPSYASQAHSVHQQSYYTPTTSSFYREPFSYSFSSYNDPYTPRYRPTAPTPSPQIYSPQPQPATPGASQSTIDDLFNQLRAQQQAWQPSPVRTQTTLPVSNYGVSTASAIQIPIARSWITPFFV